MSTPVSDFDYDLPSELIAQEAAAVRDRARLLHLDRSSNDTSHLHVIDLADRLKGGDLLVVNDTRVYAARLVGHRNPSGGQVECLLLSQLSKNQWDVLMHPGQKLGEGAHVVFGEGDDRLELEVLERHFHGRRTVRLLAPGPADVHAVIDAIGHTPLPPYIRRPADRADSGRYQTMFAKVRGSVAAPTAGLHFTPTLMAKLRTAGIDCTAVTLHVGYGTFEPMRGAYVEDRRVATEHFEVTPRSATKINRALDEGRRFVAVGTTATRVLETVVRRGDGRMIPRSGETDLFIHPGFDFRVVGGLVTNFHMPKSSLLVLVAAFSGRERVLKAYAEAVSHRYRFNSYGDAMLIT